MPKSARLLPAGESDRSRVAELSAVKSLQVRLDQIISELDKAKQPLAAAYAQMARDVLRD